MEERFHTFTVLIANISRNIRKIKTLEMAEYNLKSPHVSCLYYLNKYDNLTASMLCEICDEDKANISRSIKHLESNGFLECEDNEKRRYARPLKLTEKGECVSAEIAEKVDKILFTTSDGMTGAERDNFYKCLSVINENLQKICDGLQEGDGTDENSSNSL